jgi:hypothetical protein
MGIAIHNLSATTHAEDVSLDLAAAVRQNAAGLLGTTVQLADLVRALKSVLTKIQIVMTWWQVIPFVAGGFLYIGAVAVLPTYAPLATVLIERSKLTNSPGQTSGREQKWQTGAARGTHETFTLWRDFSSVTERIAVWGDGVRGALHVLCSVSATL